MTSATKPAPGSSALPPAIAHLATSIASQHNVSASLVRAVIWVESRGNPAAQSAKGAQGLMQLMPLTAAGLGVHDPFDPQSNVDGGVRYLGDLLRKYRGDEGLALAAYNWGPGNVDAMLAERSKLPKQVEEYVRKVQAYRNSEGNRTAASPLASSQSLQFCLACPFCSANINVRAMVDVRDIEARS